jgi:hypothetical protein
MTHSLRAASIWIIVCSAMWTPCSKEKTKSLRNADITVSYECDAGDKEEEEAELTVVLRTMTRYFISTMSPSMACRFTRSGCINNRPGFLIAPVGNESSLSNIFLRQVTHGTNHRQEPASRGCLPFSDIHLFKNPTS